MKAATTDFYIVGDIPLISIHAAREGGDPVPMFPAPEQEFQSTPPVKAATVHGSFYCQQLGISIHAAREGGDQPDKYTVTATRQISIHAAREGGDVCNDKTDINADIFQSTPPVKAATFRAGAASTATLISIHAAREGGDRV